MGQVNEMRPCSLPFARLSRRSLAEFKWEAISARRSASTLSAAWFSYRLDSTRAETQLTGFTSKEFACLHASARVLSVLVSRAPAAHLARLRRAGPLAGYSPPPSSEFNSGTNSKSNYSTRS